MYIPSLPKRMVLGPGLLKTVEELISQRMMDDDFKSILWTATNFFPNLQNQYNGVLAFLG